MIALEYGKNKLGVKTWQQIKKKGLRKLSKYCHNDLCRCPLSQIETAVSLIEQRLDLTGDDE